MRRYILFALTFLPFAALAQQSFSKKEQIVANKNFFCTVQLQQYDNNHRSKIFDQLQRDKISAIGNAIGTRFDDGQGNLLLFKFSGQDVQAIGSSLAKLYQSDKSFRQFVSDSILGFNKYLSGDSPLTGLQRAWETDAKGMNHVIDVYGLGKPPNYPAIDSISFNVRNRNYPFFLAQTEELVYNNLKGNKVNIPPGLAMALQLLELNGRFEAADYEPMQEGENKPAVGFIKTINWTKYRYSFILVPGAGTDNYTDTINPVGIIRCRLAKAIFDQGLAPIIIVSGARVHPYRTKYTEAMVMKNYLVNELGLPRENVLIEPHARHTTTNIRNANRLAIAYGIPLEGRALIATDRSQSSYITNQNFDNRCLKELGYLPYVLGERINPLLFEYTPVRTSLIINSLEPLDP